jgi:hypothetical protein
MNPSAWITEWQGILARGACASAFALAVGIAGPAAQTADVPAPGLGVPGKSGWHRAERTLCLVWNDVPQPDEVAIWTGACVAGFAEGPGQLRWVHAGKEDCFRGTMRLGRAQGYGIYVWARSERYEAETLNGVPTGRLVRRWYYGARYDGDYVDGRRDGRGIYVWANGDRYEGDFKDNHMHGRGVFTWANGDRYEGEYVRSERTGRGQFTPAKPGDKREPVPDPRSGSDGCDAVS